jgi:hypothetical protein
MPELDDVILSCDGNRKCYLLSSSRKDMTTGSDYLSRAPPSQQALVPEKDVESQMDNMYPPGGSAAGKVRSPAVLYMARRKLALPRSNICDLSTCPGS